MCFLLEASEFKHLRRPRFSWNFEPITQWKLKPHHPPWAADSSFPPRYRIFKRAAVGGKWEAGNLSLKKILGAIRELRGT